MKIIRTGIIGYGNSGRISHAYGIKANAAFDLAAVCDLSEENRRRATEENGCRVYATHKELLEAEDLDLACVVTRSDTHAEITCDCLRAGVHVVVTKPWALNTAEALSMMETAKQSSRTIFPWIPMYWAPEYTCIREILSKGTIGDVFLIRRQYADFNRRDDWQTEKRYGGGYLLNWGMHIVQPVLGLAGSPVKRVFGQLQQTINPGDADDNFLAVMEFENGIRGIAEFTESFFPLPSFLIQGTRGSILVEGSTLKVKTKDPANEKPEKTFTHELEGKLFGDEADIYRDISRTLLNGETFKSPSETALEGTRILDAIRRSSETRTVVPLEY